MFVFEVCDPNSSFSFHKEDLNSFYKYSLTTHMDTKRIVIPSLTGGLGSRMFQIATALAYGERWKRIPLLHETFTQQDPLCHVDDLFPYLEKSCDTTLLHNPTTLPDAYPLRPSVSKVVVLEGEFQDPRYFEEKEVHIEFPDCFRPMPELAETAFLHIRVKDIPPNKQVKLTHYYVSAIKKLPSDCSIMVFSDDIDWCKEHIPQMFSFVDTSRWEWEPDGLADVEALFLMSQCKKGAICANSAFSWWGAYLGCRQVKAPVYMPIKWVLASPKVDGGLQTDKKHQYILPPWAKGVLC